MNITDFFLFLLNVLQLNDLKYLFENLEIILFICIKYIIIHGWIKINSTGIALFYVRSLYCTQPTPNFPREDLGMSPTTNRASVTLYTSADRDNVFFIIMVSIPLCSR